MQCTTSSNVAFYDMTNYLAQHICVFRTVGRVRYFSSEYCNNKHAAAVLYIDSIATACAIKHVVVLTHGLCHLNLSVCVCTIYVYRQQCFPSCIRVLHMLQHKKCFAFCLYSSCMCVDALL
jgi:hypothetical protein